jgi:uncharacterized protein
LLRVWSPKSPTPALRWVESQGVSEVAAGRRARTAILDQATFTGPVQVDVITAVVTITDTATDIPRTEVIENLGLSHTHPSAVERGIREGSRLLQPAGDWPSRILPPDVLLTPVFGELRREGQERWADVRAESFVGSVDAGLLPVGGTEPIDPDLVLHGVDRMSLEPDIGLLCVPDLLWDTVVDTASPLEPTIRRRSPVFAPCLQEPASLRYKPSAPEATLLQGPAALETVVARQRRLVELAERQRRFVVLLDVPGGLGVADAARWRASFSSSYAAAYMPWLRVSPSAGKFRRLAPSAAAAGIIASRERRLGLPAGPAGELAVGAVDAGPVTENEHDSLHLLDINVFRAERDGFRLTAARTLSTDPNYRQLSVRRLMTLVRLSMERQGQWLAFEPHTEDLRREVSWTVTRLLRDLYREGAFAGATEDEAFFVRCDVGNNNRWEQEQGRLLAEIGVAPTAPLEYILFRLVRNTGDAITVEG